MTSYDKKIIVNADDFGRHPLINRAVARSVETGLLRSATLMPGGKAFDGAVEIARAHPALGVGIHLTLVNGFPLCPPEEIPSLVTPEGVFFDDHSVFVRRFLKGQIAMEDVRRELAAQVEKMMRTGLPVTHIDSHQHMHVLPGIIEIALDTASAAGIHAVRIPRTPLFAGGGSLGQLIGRSGLAALAYLAAAKAKRRSFQMPDHFEGIVAGEAVSKEYFTHILNHLGTGVTEIMMHPGTDTAVLQKDCAWQHDFEAELQAITSRSVMALAERQHIRPVNFRDL